MKKVLQLQGLDCAHCAAELEEEISEIEGVLSASVSFVNQKLTVEYETPETLERVVYAANRFEAVSVVEEPVKKKKNEDGYELKTENEAEKKSETHRKDWILIAISAIFFAVGTLLEALASGLVAEIFRYVCYAVAYFSVGYPVLFFTVKNVAKGKIFDENFLMTVASVGAVALGEIGEGVLVMLLYQIGETLQSIAVSSSRRSITKLMDLKSERATKLIGSEYTEVEAEELRAGDILLVKAGEKIPVDGQLLSSVATLDTKSLTGESELRTANAGGELLSGCVNAGDSFFMKAIRPYEDSAVAKILDMVENASSGKAAPEKFITKFAKYYTPIVCGLALLLAVVAPLLSGLFTEGNLYFKDFPRWVHSALTFLVVSCPCALIISVPLTYFSGVGACAKQGALVKGATYLDILAKAKIVAFDKTGTLTYGDFTVLATHMQNGASEERILALAAAVEKHSAHPIAKAFSSVKTELVAENVSERAGRGLSARVNGNAVLIGNVEWMKENGVETDDAQSVHTLVCVAENGVCLGTVEIGDRLRADAKTALSQLKLLGIERTVMLTGDNERRAKKIADEAGVYEVSAELLPDRKLERAQELKKDGLLVYVGDGVNDAPVMAASDCAVSMGKLGSAAAVEASDLVLISDQLAAIPRSIRTARKTRKIVLENIVFSILMKTAFMALGAIGILPLWLAVFADVGVMLIAVLNSFRVRIGK